MLDRLFRRRSLTPPETLKPPHQPIGGEVHKYRDAFPAAYQDIEVNGSLGGSSDVMEGSYEGRRFALKKARHAEDPDTAERYREQLKEEYVADKIYEIFGHAVPVSQMYSEGGYKVSPYIEGKNLDAIQNEPEELRKVREQIRKGFVLDCFLANWDVVGGALDNIRIGQDGKVYRIDNGGALRFRARGEYKGEDFSGEVSELESMRERNPLYDGISEDEIRSQISDLLTKKEKLYETIVRAGGEAGMTAVSQDTLISIVSKRLLYLEKYLQTHEAQERITNRFFEGWDELKLSGNEGILGTIRKNILEVEKRMEGSYEREATRMGISIGKFKESLQQKAESIVAQSQFFRATNVSVVDAIMNQDGRWKSQFETNTSGGCLSSDYRAREENQMFGFQNSDVSMEVEQRPIYGFFSDDENGVINTAGTIPPENSVRQYGRVNFKVKRDVALQKATVTFGDSLGSSTHMTPTPAAKPHFTSLPSHVSGETLRVLERSRQTNWGESYTEVQYHGQLTMDDIESIHISRENGMDEEDMETVRLAYKKYMESHPDSQLKLVEY